MSTKKLKPAVLEAALQSGMTIQNEDFISVHYLDIPRNELVAANECLVFTSQHGVKAFIKNIGEKELRLPFKKIYCLQGETLRLAEVLENTEILGTATNARGLAEKIVSDVTVKKLSFFCGDKRRDELPAILKQHGVELEEIEIYRTEAMVKRINTAVFDGVFFFSPSAAESFFQTNVLKQSIPCFCIGGTTANYVEKYAGNETIVADDPTQESMLLAATNYFSDQKKSRKI